MKNNMSHLDEMKGQNPFKLPEGYMEGLTEQIMSQLPKKEPVVVKQISMFDRVRPWLYLAAVFAGLGLFFKAIVGVYDFGSDKATRGDSLLVQSFPSAQSYPVFEEELYDEEEDYLDYLENQYASYIIAHEMDGEE